MTNEAEDVSLDELIERDLLSVRTINICRDFGLTTARKILAFKETHGHFRKLRGCGVNTETELNYICENFQGLIMESVTTANERALVLEQTFADEVSELIPLKRLIFNKHFDYLFSKLSVRARNGIENISKDKNTREVLETIFAKDFDFSSIRNIGSKTVTELIQFRQDIYDFFPNLNRTENDELNIKYARLVIQTNYPDLPVDFNTCFDLVFDEFGKIKVFALIKLLLDFDLIFDTRTRKVFDFTFTKKDDDITLDTIASEVKVSRERIRQIKVELEAEIQSYFPFIAHFSLNDFVSYEIEGLQTFSVIDNSFTDRINQKEGTNFNSIFICLVLRILHKNAYQIFSIRKKILESREASTGKNCQDCYLIPNRLFEAFLYESFTEDIYKQLNSRITETYTLHFEGYLCQFLTEDSRQLLNQIKPTCETILFNQFDLLVNTDGYIVFERNAKKSINEYVSNVLESENRMMKVEEIKEAIDMKFPFLEITEQAIRSSIQREKGVFICFGRTSTYGLRKWESEKENLKGGTIRDIVEIFLKNSDSPKHISEIAEHVMQYRVTNERSILTSIKAEGNKRFLTFDGYYIGLRNKTYSMNTLNYKRVVGSHFVPKMLKKVNDLDLEEAIRYYENKYGYAKIQIRRILQYKIAQGQIHLTSDNKLKT